jgi:3-hydroxyisobutyrate dehydrogenase-like beta-hydroxyacid dehydrogenase
VDATLTGGGEAAARAGELTLMVGAETRDFERCLPVFQKMATNVVHIGPPGSGAKAKIINNFVVISSMAALREALDVATGIGISEEVMCDIFKSGRMASSWMSQHWNDVRGMEDAHEGGNMVPSAVGSMRKMAGLAREANKNCSMHVHMEQVLQTLTNGVTRPNS